MKKTDLGRLARGFFAGIAIGAAILCAILSYPELRAFLKGPMARDGMGMFMAFWMAAVLLFAAAVFLQTLIHETGHLVSGLATGYRFSSFRIGSFMLYRGDEGLRFGRFTVAGTGGQCLLEPSDTTDPENMPYEAYLLGGVAANLATAAAAFAASIYAESVFGIYLCVAIMLAGVVAALLNGIPMRIGGVPNDGCTVRMMGRNAEMRRMMWVQLKVNALYSRGEMLRDMTDEWFALPDDADMSNHLYATIAGLDASRRMERGDFAGAYDRLETMRAAGDRLIGLFRMEAACEQMTAGVLTHRGGGAICAALFALHDKPRPYVIYMGAFRATRRREGGGGCAARARHGRTIPRSRRGASVRRVARSCRKAERRRLWSWLIHIRTSMPRSSTPTAPNVSRAPDGAASRGCCCPR